MRLNTYLHFNGNCEEALAFYIKALGAKPVMMLRYGQAPEQEMACQAMQDKIMHGRIALGEDVIMASDAPPDRFEKRTGFCINLNVDTPQEAERLFKALSEKAENICLPFGETFWAHGFGMLVDQFGTPWMVNCEKKG